MTTNERIRLAMAAIITLAWIVSFIVDIQVETYDPPAYIGPLMLIVAGSVFGEGLVRSAVKQIIEKQNGNGTPPKEPPRELP